MDAARLDQLVAKVLKEELREDGNTREQGLKQFRDWILKSPDIRDCPTDDNFLLPFLRVRKYSVPMAEETLLRLLKFQHNFPSLNSNLDFQDPGINHAISSGYYFPSPIRGKNGESSIFLIAKNLDVTKYPYQTSVRTFLLSLYTLVRGEATHTLGVNFICDFSNVSPAFFTFFPVAVARALTENMQKAIPLRYKKMHVVNLPPVANWFMKLILSMLSEKWRSRTFFHSSMEELKQHIDVEVLPKEHGGTMPLDEMIGLWKKELAEHHASIRAQTNIKLVGDSSKNDLESNDTGIPDLPGSFRKLEVD